MNLIFAKSARPVLQGSRDWGIQDIAVMETAVPEMDIVLLAVPDILIGKLSPEIIPIMKPGAMVVGLDPAAAYANVMPVREIWRVLMVLPITRICSILKWMRTGNRICSEVLSPRIVPALFTRRLREKKRSIMPRERRSAGLFLLRWERHSVSRLNRWECASPGWWNPSVLR